MPIILTKRSITIRNHRDVGVKDFKDLKAFIQNSNDMKDICKSIKKNRRNKIEVLIVFDVIADVISTKKLHSVVIELFIWGRNLNIYLGFMTQLWFLLLKDVKLNTIHFFLMKVPNRQKLQQIAINNSSDTDCNEF